MTLVLLEPPAALQPIAYPAPAEPLQTEPLQIPATMDECPGGGLHNLQPYSQGGVTYYKCSKCSLDTGAGE